MSDIVIEGLYKVFGSASKQDKAMKAMREGADKAEVLDKLGVNVGVIDANLHIHDKQIFVIMGLSGSGKSTLLRLINRLIEPTAGRIVIDGHDVTSMNKQELRKFRQENMSMVFQNFGLFPHRTVLENTAYPLDISGVNQETSHAKAREAIETVGLAGYEDNYPDELSGGMQQRVGLARALAGDADILLMDEAFSALDPLIRKDMQDELLELQDSLEKTIVFITHDLNEALKLGDQIAIMRDAEIVQVGTPEDILTNPANEYVERFTEDAVISRVISVRQIMREAHAIQTDRSPAVALRMMKKNGISDLFVVTPRRKLLGIVTADMLRGVREGTVIDYMDTEVPSISPDATLAEAVEVAAETRMPIAVVENDRLIGAAIKGAILGGMTGSYDYNEIDEEGHAEAAANPIPEHVILEGGASDGNL